MKKAIAILCLAAMLLTLGACRGGQAPFGDVTEGAADGALRLRVVDGADSGRLVLAGKSGGELYTADASSLTVYLDGEKAGPGALADGMLLTVDPDVTVLETWPGQLTGATVRASGKADKDDRGDLCGVYLQVLEDLWREDDALNDGIEYVSVDLSDAPGALTDGEKAAIAWIFAGAHGKQGLQLRLDELKAQGYVDESRLYWENGVLFSIKKAENGADSAKKISFDAEKWRSGLGAILYTGCTAARGDGLSWKPYKPGEFAVA